MSKKRIILLTALGLLILATVAFFLSSVMKKSPAPASSGVEKIQPIRKPAEKIQPAENVLEPLPTDNKAAIESEMTNIEKELDSSIETELNELSDIENTL